MHKLKKLALQVSHETTPVRFLSESQPSANPSLDSFYQDLNFSTRAEIIRETLGGVYLDQPTICPVRPESSAFSAEKLRYRNADNESSMHPFLLPAHMTR